MCIGMSMRFRPLCPHCTSHDLTFLEHGSGASVFLCRTCARTTVEHYEAAPAVVFKAPANDFVFPSWFTGDVRG